MDNITKFKKILIVSVISTLMGQVYVNPFNSFFRLSIGVAVLTFLILWFENLSITIVTTSTAIFIYLFRTSLDVVQGVEISHIYSRHLPAVAFYIVMGMILYRLNIRKYKSQPVLLVFLLASADVISNIVEMIVRNEFKKVMIEPILNRLLIIAFGRAIIAVLLYSTVRFFNMLILKEAHQKRYRELLLFTANMKAEIFFLKKTTQLIEQAMEESFSIYAYFKKIQYRESKVTKKDVNMLKDKALNLSKDIHEIKKDNKRVVLGIEKLLPSETDNSKMFLESVFEILNDNTNRFIEYLNKDIKLEFDYNVNLSIKNYYSLITVINNLVNNSIGAISKTGIIRISQSIMGDYAIFHVYDNGCGIHKKDLDVIFEPGYSTKFDRKTGHMSTGIGLSHVRNIVYNKFGGKILVDSNRNSGTSFYIHIPIKNL